MERKLRVGLVLDMLEILKKKGQIMRNRMSMWTKNFKKGTEES